MRYNISKQTAPTMPNLGKGVECIKLLASQVTPDMREAIVPMIFPALGAHVCGTEFQYPDLTWKEPTGMMANLVGDSDCNKGQLSNLVEAICRDFRQHDEGAYAQALYLLDHDFQPKPSQEESQLITDHNRNFMEPSDCEEAIFTFLTQPDGLHPNIALSAGDIMRELNSRGFHGREFNAVNIGKIMKQNEFESKIIKGTRKYLVVMVDYDLHVRENKADASHFVPDVF